MSRAIVCGVAAVVAVGMSLGASFRPVAAQTSYPNVKVSGRLQEHFYYFDNSDYAGTVGPKGNFFIRRARIEARVDITDRVFAFIQPSFEGGRTVSATTTTCAPIVIPVGGGTVTPNCRTTGRSGVRLRDAYIDVHFSPKESRSGLFLRAGQEKRPFSRYELISSTNLPSIERGAGAGLPGAASNNLFDANGFLSHDVGASARLEYQLDDARLVTLKAGVYNGQGESLNDVNERKSFGVRGTVGITPKLDVGASFFSHDQIVTSETAVDSGFTNGAFGVDAQWGKPGDAGLFALAEYLEGDDRTAPDQNRMRGFQAVAAYNVRLSSPTSWLYAIEPAVRFDIADPASGADDDRATLITGVLGVYISSRAQFRVAYERQSFQVDDLSSVQGVRSALTVSF